MRDSFRVAVFGLAVCLAVCLPRFAKPLSAAEQSVTCAARVSTPPRLDGRLDEPAWRRAPGLDLFVRSDDGQLAHTPTRGRLLWDDKALYVGVWCREPDLAGVRGKTEQRDAGGIRQDDCVGVLVTPPGGATFHLVVNVIGTLYDETTLGDPASWDSKATARTCVTEGYWEAELRLPWESLKVQPKSDVSFRFDLWRHRSADGELSSWSGARGASPPIHPGGVLFLAKTPLVFTWADVGDLFGDLSGGAAVRGEVYNPAAVPQSTAVQVAVVDVRGNVAVVRNTIEVAPYEIRPVTLTYRDKLRAPQALRLKAMKPESAAPFFVSPRIVLRPRFFQPRIDLLRARLQRNQPPPTRQAAHARANRLKALDALERELAAPEPPTPRRWQAIDKRLHALEAEVRESLSTGEKRGSPPRAPKAAASPPSADEESYVLFPVFPFDPVTPETAPRLEAIGEPVVVVGCPGEWEPGALVLSAVADLHDVTIAVTDLTGERGTLSADTVAVRIVKCWPQFSATAEDHIRPQTPELLLPDDRATLTGMFPEIAARKTAVTDVAAGTSKQVWLTVHIPGDAAPGLYTGKVVVTPAAHPPASLNLRVRVLPFRLPAPGGWMVMGYRARLGRHPGPVERTADQYRRELQDIFDHGFQYATLAATDSRLREAVKARRTVGMKGLLPCILPAPAPDAVSALRRVVEGTGHWTVLATPSLARLPAADASLRRQLENIRKAHGVTFALVAVREAASLSSRVDLPVYAVTDPDFTAYLKARTAGKKPHARTELYSWDCTRETPVLNRLFCGYYLYKSGLRGVLAREYQRLPGKGTPTPYDEVAAGVHYPLVTYPSATGPVPTIQWEAAREGVDDLRYVRLLEQTLRGTALPPRAPERRKAEGFLSRLRATVQLNPSLAEEQFYPKRFQEIRWEVIRLVQAMKKAAAPPRVTTVRTRTKPLSARSGS